MQQKIDELTGLDRILYDAGKKEFEKVKFLPFRSAEMSKIIGPSRQDL